MSEPLMNRRELIQRVAYLMGGAVSAPAILGVLNGCTAQANNDFRPQFLTQPQLDVVAEIAEIMIPRTDTPGAKDVGVPQFIDTMLHKAYTKADRTRYVAGLDELGSHAQRQHGRAFLSLEAPQRAALVQRVHDEAASAERALRTPSLDYGRPFMLMTKELTLLGFFTSQVGATQVLQYDPVPGAFRACVPLKEAGNGRTWALETSSRF